MNIRNILIAGGLIILVAALITACGEDFLDTPVQGSLSEDVLTATEEGIDASLISTYHMLNGFTNTVGNTWGSAPSNYIFNSASDDLHKGSEPSDNPDGYFEVATYQWSPGHLVYTHKFQAVYEGVRRANNTIQLANQFVQNGGDAGSADEIIGEAKVLRAWYHFEAYKFWENIPYYDETDLEYTKPNTTDVLPEIMADLEEAIPDLPLDRTATGRVDRTVAWALLGKVKLYDQDWAAAKTNFDSLMTYGSYALEDCYQDLFTISTQNGSESIFAHQASVNDGDDAGANSNYLERLAAPHTGSHTGCCGFSNPTQDLANSYQVDGNGLPLTNWNSTRATVGGGANTVDPRIDWTMGRTGVPYLDWGPHSDGWIRGAGWAGLYSPKKNMKMTTDEAGPGWTTNQLHAKNVELIRYADVLLMLAEAEVELNNLNRAEELVNMIRNRAANCAQGPGTTSGNIVVDINDPSITWASYDVQPYPIGTFATNGQVFARDAVRRERRLELAGEGHRVFDLRRWGILEQTINAYRTYESTVTNMVAGKEVRVADLDNAATVTADHYRFPLPNTEIDLSRGNLQQNPGPWN